MIQPDTSPKPELRSKSLPGRLLPLPKPHHLVAPFSAGLLASCPPARPQEAPSHFAQSWLGRKSGARAEEEPPPGSVRRRLILCSRRLLCTMTRGQPRPHSKFETAWAAPRCLLRGSRSDCLLGRHHCLRPRTVDPRDRRAVSVCARLRYHRHGFQLRRMWPLAQVSRCCTAALLLRVVRRRRWSCPSSRCSRL